VPAFEIKCDVSGAVEGMEKLLGDDLPFAVALFLTKQAQTGQKAARGLEQSGIFRLRNDWTVRNTKIEAATKKNLQSIVYTDTSNWTTGAPDYLPRQGEGGERVPVDGRQHLAIPTDYLRRLAGGPDKPIPDWLRPKALLEYARNNGKWTAVRGKLRGQLRGAPQAVRGMYFFRVTFKSGAEGILARYVSDPREQVYPMYIFVTRAHLRKRFPMEQSVEQQLAQSMDQDFERAALEVFTNRDLGWARVTF